MQNWHPLLVQHNHLDASILLPAFRIVRTSSSSFGAIGRLFPKPWVMRRSPGRPRFFRAERTATAARETGSRRWNRCSPPYCVIAIVVMVAEFLLTPSTRASGIAIGAIIALAPFIEIASRLSALRKMPCVICPDHVSDLTGHAVSLSRPSFFRRITYWRRLQTGHP